MHHLIYLSQATVPFSDEQLQYLLLQARGRNAQLGVTGILLYGNEQFLQVLEGDEQVVTTLYERIRQDPRHRDVTAYANKEIPARAFEGWAMAYQSLAPQQFTEYASLIAPADLQLERPNLSQADQQLLALLRSFVLPA